MKTYETKNGYTYIHDDEGLPESVKIEKNKDFFYNYAWGRMVVDKNGHYYSFHAEDWELLFNLLWNGVVVKKNDKYGMVDDGGNEVLPCVFDQIEKLRESVFGRLGGSYWEFRRDGNDTVRDNYEDPGFFVENGKKGWQANGRVIVPAAYDDIFHASDSNYYGVYLDGKWSYIKEDGTPVLTYVREIDGADEEIPFPFRTDENDVIVLQEYVGHEDANDHNVILRRGVWQRLDRISGKEICNLLVNPDDEMPLTDADLELFNNKFSYEFASYQVTSQEPQGVIDCLKKLQSMGLHDNSWFYIVKVWKPVGEKTTAEELRFLRSQIKKHGQLGKLHFCLAHDENLCSGETKMFVVTHYNE